MDRLFGGLKLTWAKAVAWAMLNPVYQIGSVAIPLDGDRCPADSTWDAKLEGDGPARATVTTFEGKSSIQLDNLEDAGTYEVALTAPDGGTYVLTVTLDEEGRFAIGYEDGSADGLW